MKRKMSIICLLAKTVQDQSFHINIYKYCKQLQIINLKSMDLALFDKKEKKANYRKARVKVDSIQEKANKVLPISIHPRIKDQKQNMQIVAVKD